MGDRESQLHIAVGILLNFIKRPPIALRWIDGLEFAHYATPPIIGRWIYVCRTYDKSLGMLTII